MQDVTAIVPTFNRARFLGECLDALIGQTAPPRQIIVVDDGSTDDTARVVAGFGDRVDYLRKENGGKSSALNLALAQATGAAIWIFDDDDIADPDALRRLSGALAADPGAGFAFGNHDNFRVDEDGRLSFIPVSPARFDLDDLHLAVLERCFIFQPALLVRRRCYDAVGPFDTGLPRAQDYEMLLRLTRHARGVHVPHILFHQRQHDHVRGPATLAIPGGEIWEKQKYFDALVLEKAHREEDLTDYLPRAARGTATPAPGDRVRALLRRAAVMARKKLWRLAGEDIDAAGMLAARHGIRAIGPAETALLSRVFDEFGYARDDLGPGNPLLRRAAALPRGPFRSALLAALSWSVFRYALLAARRGDAAGFLRHARLYAGLMDARTLPRHVSRLVGGARALTREAHHAA